MTRKLALAALAVAALTTGSMFANVAQAQSPAPNCPPRAAGCNGGAPVLTQKGLTVRDQTVRRSNRDIGIGIAAGIGGLIIGSAIANAHPRGYGETRYHAEPRHRGHGYGFRTVNAYAADDEDCFQKPIRRFDPYSGRVVVVGTKVVCR
jgi:hypothetical protein